MISLGPDNIERTISTVGWVLSRIRCGNEPMRWFICFGYLLGHIRDGGFVRDKDGNIKQGEDIDIGVLYEELNDGLAANNIINGFGKFGYNVDHKITNNIDGKIFYINFKNPKLPDICLFAWYKHNNIRYHTYDFNREKKDIPTEYVFKGIPAFALEKVVKHYIKEANKEVHFPLMYGTCLDVWYPNWKIKREGESETPYLVKMKSCKEFETIK